MSIDTIHIGVQAVALIGAVGVLTYSVFGNKVSKWRRPLYYIALPVVASLAFVYTESFLSRAFGFRAFGFDRLGLILRIALFLLTLLFYLVPYVDRLEHRLASQLGIIGADAQKVRDDLDADHRAVMGEQRQVMGEQRIVMDDQRLGLKQDREERLRKDDN